MTRGRAWGLDVVTFGTMSLFKLRFGFFFSFVLQMNIYQASKRCERALCIIGRALALVMPDEGRWGWCAGTVAALWYREDSWASTDQDAPYQV